MHFRRINLKSQSTSRIGSETKSAQSDYKSRPTICASCVRSFQFISVNNVYTVCQQAAQHGQLLDVILAISVSIKNQILLGLTETRLKRCPVSQVALVMNNS